MLNAKRGIAVAAFTLAALTAQAASAADPIKIAVIAPTTGAWSPLGQEALRGVEIARDIQNTKGGINGRRIELIIADTPTTEAAVAEAERLVNTEGVHVIVSSMISGLSQAIAPIAERAKVISWHLNASSDAVTQQGFKYLFRTSGFGSDEGVAMANFTADTMKGQGIETKDIRVAIVFEDGVYGTFNGEAGKQRAEELGMQVVHYEGYNKSTQDLSSMILKLKEANPDVIFMTGYGPDTKIFLRQAKTQGLAPKMIIGTGAAIGSNWFRETYGHRANGFVASNWPVERTSSDFAPGLAEFMAMYREKTGNEHLYSTHSATAYTGMLILFDVLERAASVDDSEAIREAALATDIPAHAIGIGWGAKFAPPGHKMMGTNLRATTVITQWQDGELYTIWPSPYPGHEAQAFRGTLDE